MLSRSITTQKFIGSVTLSLSKCLAEVRKRTLNISHLKRSIGYNYRKTNCNNENNKIITINVRI